MALRVRGFTLLEVLLVAGLLAVLGGLVLGVLSRTSDASVELATVRSVQASLAEARVVSMRRSSGTTVRFEVDRGESDEPGDDVLRIEWYDGVLAQRAGGLGAAGRSEIADAAEPRRVREVAMHGLRLLDAEAEEVEAAELTFDASGRTAGRLVALGSATVGERELRASRLLAAERYRPVAVGLDDAGMTDADVGPPRGDELSEGRLWLIAPSPISGEVRVWGVGPGVPQRYSPERLRIDAGSDDWREAMERAAAQRERRDAARDGVNR